LFLFQRWVKTVSVGFFCHALHSTRVHVKPSWKACPELVEGDGVFNPFF
jgi:hypothetical protein